jgi:hypothetical protein
VTEKNHLKPLHVAVVAHYRDTDQSEHISCTVKPFRSAFNAIALHHTTEGLSLPPGSHCNTVRHIGFVPRRDCRPRNPAPADALARSS